MATIGTGIKFGTGSITARDSQDEVISETGLKMILPINESNFFKNSEYNSRVLKLALIQIKNYYSSKGYINALIKHNLIHGNNKISIQINIDEGSQYYIRKIELFGNRLFSNERILSEMNIKTNDVFNPIKITKELKKIIHNYLTEGKFYISIVDELLEDENGVIIRINIAEGRTYYFGNIEVEGLEKLNIKTVERESLIRTGSKYNIVDIEKTQTRIFSSLLFSSVEVLPRMRDEIQDTIDLLIKVKEMNDRGIKGEIGYGQAYPPSEEEYVGLPLNFIELTSTFQSGFFFNTSSKFNISIGLGTTINQNLSLFENKLFPKRNFSIGYRTPWFIGLRIPFNLKYYNEYLETDNYENKHGIESSFLYRKSDQIKLLGSIILELVNDESNVECESNELQNSNENVIELINNCMNSEELEKLERKVRITYQRHTLDNLVSPMNGYYFSYNTTLRGTFLGGKTHYLLNDIEFKNFRNIFDLWVVGIRLKLGFIKLLRYTEEEDMSYTDFFSLGGSTSLRGWRSPCRMDALDGCKDNQLYYNKPYFRILNNIEFRFPIYNNLGGEIFFDGGILGKNKNDLQYSSIFWDIGYGLTYKTPLGPIRIDVAYQYGKKLYLNNLTLLYLF